MVLFSGRLVTLKLWRLRRNILIGAPLSRARIEGGDSPQDSGLMVPVHLVLLPV